jgi:hypothetical protein
MISVDDLNGVGCRHSEELLWTAAIPLLGSKTVQSALRPIPALIGYPQDEHTS